MLSCFFPHGRREYSLALGSHAAVLMGASADPCPSSLRPLLLAGVHYWAKSTLFKPGLAAKILTNAGNIPVDRRTKASPPCEAVAARPARHAHPASVR